MKKTIIALLLLLLPILDAYSQSFQMNLDDWKGEAAAKADTVFIFNKENMVIAIGFRSFANKIDDKTIWRHEIDFVASTEKKVLDINSIYVRTSKDHTIKTNLMMIDKVAGVDISHFQLKEIKMHSTFSARVYFSSDYYKQISFSDKQIEYLLNYVKLVEENGKI